MISAPFDHRWPSPARFARPVRVAGGPPLLRLAAWLLTGLALVGATPPEAAAQLPPLPAQTQPARSEPGDATPPVAAPGSEPPASGLPAAGAPFSPATRPPDLLSERTRYEPLRNGVQAVVVEDRSRPIISVQLWVRSGYADDDELPGTCELVRRVLAVRHIADAPLHAAHLHWHTETLADATVLHSLIPADELLFEAVLRRHADVLHERPIDARELSAAVEGAKRELTSTHAPSPLNALRAMLFSGHPYSVRSPTADDLAAAADTAEEFRKTRFVSRSAVVVVVGDVTRAAAMTAIREAFEPIPDRPRPIRADRDIPRHTAHEIRLPEIEGPQRVTLGWVTPFYSDFENVVLEVLMHRVCNPDDGPLHRTLIESGCGVPEWRLTRLRDAGMLTITMTSDGADPGRRGRAILDRVVAALRDTGTAPNNPIELLRARALATAALRAIRCDFPAMALRLGEMEAVGGDLLIAELDFARVQRVLASDVRDVALALAENQPLVDVTALPMSNWSVRVALLPERPFDAVPPLVQGATAPRVRVVRTPDDAGAPRANRGLVGMILDHRTDAGTAVVSALGGNTLETRVESTADDPGLRAQLSFRGFAEIGAPHRRPITLVGPAEQADALVELLDRNVRREASAPDGAGGSTTDPLPGRLTAYLASAAGSATASDPTLLGIVGAPALVLGPATNADDGAPDDPLVLPPASAAAVLRATESIELYALVQAEGELAPPLWPELASELFNATRSPGSRPSDPAATAWNARPFGDRAVLLSAGADAETAPALLRRLDSMLTEIADMPDIALEQAYRRAAVRSYEPYLFDASLARYALECAILSRPVAELREFAPATGDSGTGAARQCLAEGGRPRLRAVIQVGGNAEMVSASGLIPAGRVQRFPQLRSSAPEPSTRDGH